ncbi:hypothetical protein K1719_002247 [Acacia pycnantha]|nr:hypothetical protein K1719_002247 [Acacia pycnantha]
MVRQGRRRQNDRNLSQSYRIALRGGAYGSFLASWLQNASDITSKRKIANLMELPPVVLIGNLFTSGNRDVYYPPPILELWYKSTQASQESPYVGSNERLTTYLA